MIIYISGKISGLLRYKAEFDKAEKELAAEGHIVLNPASIPAGLKSYEDYMDICFVMIDKADAIFMLRNWSHSPGARREKECAEAQGKKVFWQARD